MTTRESYTTQHLTDLLNQLMAATKKGDITREACEEAKNCAAAIIILVSFRFENADLANIEVTVDDAVALGDMPALKPLFDAVEACQSARIIDESKRIRAELDRLGSGATPKNA
jgi:hypothetical protein